MMEQQQQQQQQQQSELSVIDAEIDEINEMISNIDRRFPVIEKYIQDIQERVTRDTIKLDEFESNLIKQGTKNFLDDPSHHLSRIFSAQKDGLAADKRSIIVLFEERTALTEQQNIHNQRLTILRGKRDAVVQRLAKQVHEKDNGFETKAAKGASGLLHVRETLRIGLVDKSQSNIGLVEKVTGSDSKPCLQLRDDIEFFEPLQELIEAWSLLDLEISDPKFLDDLLRHVPSLEPTAVEIAWRALNFPYRLNNGDHLGETAFQQYLHTPFCALFLAASGGLKTCYNYKTNQKATASVTVLYKEKEDGQPGVPRNITVMPDAAATLWGGWDVFGMMAVVPCQEEAYLHHLDKCAIMTALTTIVLKKCMDKKYYNEIAIPFLIAKGLKCSLYVTTLDNEGNPQIRVVQYPSRATRDRIAGTDNDFSKASDEGRTKSFVALAILLNKIKALFQAQGSKRYNGVNAAFTWIAENVPYYSLP